MNAVGAIDIDVAGRAEHDGVALGWAAKAVRRRFGMMIGLDLDQPPADTVDEERHADQIGRHLKDAAVEEAPGQAFRHAAIVASSALLGKSRINRAPWEW